MTATSRTTADGPESPNDERDADGTRATSGRGGTRDADLGATPANAAPDFASIPCLHP